VFGTGVDYLVILRRWREGGREGGRGGERDGVGVRHGMPFATIV